MLKTKLTETPMFAYQNQDDQFNLATGASNNSIGAELLQCQDGIERLIIFGSVVIYASQRNHCIIRKELLAVVRFTKHFKHFLLGRIFTIRTDHNIHTWLMEFKNIEGQLARWLEELSMYNMQIVHMARRKYVNNCYSAGSKVDGIF